VATDFDNQDYEAIGRAVVACARVEGMARPILAALMNVQEGMAQIASPTAGTRGSSTRCRTPSAWG
jgi:hypothetical protein